MYKMVLSRRPEGLLGNIGSGRGRSSWSTPNLVFDGDLGRGTGSQQGKECCASRVFIGE